MGKLKKAVVIMAVLLVGAICAGYALGEYIADTTITQIEAKK